MTSLSYDSQHGTTKGPISADFFISKFPESEGVEQANLMAKHMHITLESIGEYPCLLYRPEEKLHEKWC